jgi:hypothetical protein
MASVLENPLQLTSSSRLKSLYRSRNLATLAKFPHAIMTELIEFQTARRSLKSC